MCRGYSLIPPPALSPQGKVSVGGMDIGGMAKWWESLAHRSLPTSPPPPRRLRTTHTLEETFIGLWPWLGMAEDRNIQK